jgi:hypothetical protein
MPTKMRYKIIARILILSVSSFVLAAPVPVREVREACADAVEGDEDVIIASGKRAAPENPYALAGSDFSDSEWRTLSQSPSGLDYGSGSHPGFDMPPSPSDGSKSPLWFKVWSAPGGTEVPWDPEGEVNPGTTTKNQPASSSNTKKV